MGNNRTIQTQYWRLVTESNWNKYHIATPAKDVDAILDHIIIDSPDFRDLDALTKEIENGTLTFIEDAENFLSKHRTDTLAS